MKVNYREAFTITSDYPIAGLNQWARMSKFKRHNHDIKAKAFFSALLYPYKGSIFIKEFEIELRTNGIHDVDNTITIPKIFVDAIRESKIVVNDNRKFYKGCYLGIDESLKKKHYSIKVFGIFTQKQ